MAKENKRTLKIEAVGDFAAGKIKPNIRLKGNWLEKAGFKPGHRVEVQSPSKGELTIRFADQSHFESEGT
jgi:hypothetical protein